MSDMELDVDSSFDDGSFLDASPDVSRVSLDLSFDLNLSQASLDVSPIRNHRATRAKMPFEVSPPRKTAMKLATPDKGVDPPQTAPKKRGRFAESQTDVLEAHFAECVSPSQEVCERLTHQLNLTLEQVKVWFQNRRQREKRGKLPKKKARLAAQAMKQRHNTPSRDKDGQFGSSIPSSPGGYASASASSPHHGVRSPGIHGHTTLNVDDLPRPFIHPHLKVLSDKKLPKIIAKAGKWASKVCRIAWSIIRIDDDPSPPLQGPNMVVQECALLLVSQLQRMEESFELPVVFLDKLGLPLVEIQCINEALFRGDTELNLPMSDIVRVAGARIQYLDAFTEDKRHPSHQILPIMQAMGNAILAEWPFDHGDIFQHCGNAVCRKLQIMYQHVFQKCDNAISPDEHTRFRAAYGRLVQRCKEAATDLDTSFEVPAPADPAMVAAARHIRRQQRHSQFAVDPSLTTYRKLREQYDEHEVPALRNEIVSLLQENAVPGEPRADEFLELICRILVDDKQCPAAEQAIADQPSSALVRFVYYNLAREYPLHVLSKAHEALVGNLPRALETLCRRLFPGGDESIMTYIQDPEEYEARLVATFGTVHSLDPGPTTMVTLLADGEWKVFDRYLDYVDSHTRPDFVAPHYFRGLAGWMEVSRVAAYVAHHNTWPAASKDQSVIATIREGGYHDLPAYRDLMEAMETCTRETIARIDSRFTGTPFKSFLLSRGGHIDRCGIGSEYGAIARLAQAALCSELINLDLSINPALNLASARVFNLE